MYIPRQLLRSLCVLALCGASQASAVVLDWSNPNITWTPGAHSQSYDIDGWAGNDITIAISGNTNKLTTDPGTGLAAPSISNTLTGGTPGNKSLIIAGDLSTQTNFTVTVTFTGAFQAATGVSFTLFDIDRDNDREKIINIWGVLADGTKVAPVITALGSAVIHTGTGLNQVLSGDVASPNSGDGSGNGNATISFGSHAIRSFTFDFKNDGGPPRFQALGIHNIDFTPVPEINPALAAGAACLLAFGFRRFAPRRRTARAL